MNHTITPSPGLASGKLSLVPQAADRDFAQMSTTVDFSTIDDMDPSFVDGHHVYFEREVPFELRVQASDSDVDGGDAPGSLEAIKVKILLRGVDSCPESVRVELSSEADLFFHYVHEVRDRDYREVQETQRLMVDFSDYASVLVRMLNQCIKEPHSHLALFSMDGIKAGARLEFIQNMEYKFVELLSLQFRASSEDIVRRHITFRYNANKSKLSLLQARLADVNALVKIKNPSLLLQLQRTPPKPGGGGSSSSRK